MKQPSTTIATLVALLAGATFGGLGLINTSFQPDPAELRGVVINQDAGGVTDAGTKVNYGQVIAGRLQQAYGYRLVGPETAQRRLAEGGAELVVKIPHGLTNQLLMGDADLSAVTVAVDSGASQAGADVVAAGSRSALARGVNAEVLLGLSTISPQVAAEYALGMDQSRAGLLEASSQADDLADALDATTARIVGVAAALRALNAQGVVTASATESRAAANPARAGTVFWIDSAAASLDELGRVWQTRLFEWRMDVSERNDLMALFYSWQNAVEVRLARARSEVSAPLTQALGESTLAPTIPGQVELATRTRLVAESVNELALEGRALRDALEREANQLARSPLSAGVELPELQISDAGRSPSGQTQSRLAVALVLAAAAVGVAAGLRRQRLRETAVISVLAGALASGTVLAGVAAIEALPTPAWGIVSALALNTAVALVLATVLWALGRRWPHLLPALAVGLMAPLLITSDGGLGPLAEPHLGLLFGR